MSSKKTSKTTTPVAVVPDAQDAVAVMLGNAVAAVAELERTQLFYDISLKPYLNSLNSMVTRLTIINDAIGTKIEKENDKEAKREKRAEAKATRIAAKAGKIKKIVADLRDGGYTDQQIRELLGN